MNANFLKRRSRVTVAAAAVAVSALTLSACGSSDSEGKEAPDGAAGSADPLKVGATSSLSGLGLRVAMEDGGFKAQGVEVESVPNQTANAAIPAVLNGQIQVAQVDTLTMLLAAEKGLPIKVVAGATEQGTDGAPGEKGQAMLLVKPGSDIKRPKDMEGRKVAVPAIKTQTWMNVAALVDADGGDSTKVDFVEVPPDQMLDLLSKGTVDVIDVNEPIGSSSIAAGKAEALNSADAPGLKGAPASLYVTSKEFLDKNTVSLGKFASAIEWAGGVVNTDRAKALEIAQSKLGFKAEALANAVVPRYAAAPLTVENITKVAELAVEYGILGAVPDVSTLFATKK